MLIREINNNAFVSLLNFRAKNSLYAERFTDLKNESARLEYFLSVRGISFIDDTKAQSVNAIWYSLESIGTQLTLIVKDIERIEELLAIKHLLMLKVKNIVFLTKKQKYEKLLRPIIGVLHYAQTMQEAVDWAYAHTEKGDAVLFCGGKKVEVAKESNAFQNAVRRL